MISVDGKMLKELGLRAMEIGTQDKWIPIAIEWIEQAETEIARLNGLLVKE